MTRRTMLALLAALSLAFMPTAAVAQTYTYAGKSDSGIRMWLTLVNEGPVDEPRYDAQVNWYGWVDFSVPAHPDPELSYHFVGLYVDVLNSAYLDPFWDFSWHTPGVSEAPEGFGARFWEVGPGFPEEMDVRNEWVIVGLTMTPEPSTLALLGGGLLALGGVGLRRRRQAGA